MSRVSVHLLWTVSIGVAREIGTVFEPRAATRLEGRALRLPNVRGGFTYIQRRDGRRLGRGVRRSQRSNVSRLSSGHRKNRGMQQDDVYVWLLHVLDLRRETLGRRVLALQKCQRRARRERVSTIRSRRRASVGKRDGGAATRPSRRGERAIESGPSAARCVGKAANARFDGNNHVRCWSRNTSFCAACRRVVGKTSEHYGPGKPCKQHAWMPRAKTLYKIVIFYTFASIGAGTSRRCPSSSAMVRRVRLILGARTLREPSAKTSTSRERYPVGPVPSPKPSLKE